MQEQVLGPILYSGKKCYIINKENYKHFSKSSDKTLGKLNCERKYHLISNTTYKNFINDQQRSASNLHIQPQIFGPINYQNKVIYALSCPIKVFKEKIIGYVYISDVYYVISEEEYLLNNDQKKMQQLQQFMQQLVRPINYYNNTEGYGISKENYEFILEIIPAIKKTKLIVNEVCYIISKKKYDSYLNMQNEHIRKLLRKIVLEQKSSKSTESYLISEDNYNHFITKIQSLKQKEKKVRHEKYYEISGETYSLLQNIQNGQQIPEQQDELPFMQQVIGQINYLNKDCYIIDKENYEYFFKLSNKQSEGQVKIKEEYNVISKEFYNEILQQLTSEKLQYMQRQILGPVNCLNEEIYIIGETYGNDLNDEQIIRRIKIDKEYYIIDKEAYDKVYDHLRFQQFVERLSVKLINHNNTVFYGIDKTNYDNIISEKIPKEQIMESMPVQENYYVIRKDAYTGYFQGNRQIENFMEQFTYDLDNWHYCIYKENYDCFFKNIINDKELKQITAVKKYHGINREVYDECILKIDPKQQVKLMLQNFTQRQVLGRLNYLGEECYVVDKENYNNLLNRIQADQRTIDQIARPIRISVDYYIIIKQTYDSHLGPVDTSSKRNDLVNYILSQNQALEEECKKLRNKISRYQAFEDECKELKSQNQAFEKECERLKSQKKEYENQITELRGEATKYQSELGDATSFHLGNQDSNSTSKLSDDIRMLHEKLVGFCNVKKKVVINYQELKELMKKYDCLTTDEISKNLISGVLERTVIETILEKTNVYLNYEKVNKKQRQDLAKNNRKQQPYLEAKILSTADELLKMTDLFTKIRVGNDRVSEAIPTKLRQQVYAILGNRGFSETFENNNDGKEHPFIVKLQEDILNIMNRYREFENQERLKKSTEEINKIIRDVITIFFFRLKVQQPIAAWYWLPKGTKIDTLRMEASWDTNETDLQFEICAFPLVGSNINQPNEKVIFPAQVIMNTLDE
ncbi:hypothetical protein RclHR1_02140011 [Rhizophagus clarus]|nr:hypothetical protein RclHR1_02140011 [Rhizophagus clarus]